MMKPDKRKKKKPPTPTVKAIIICEGEGEVNYFNKLLDTYFPQLVGIVQIKESDDGHRSAQVLTEEAFKLHKTFKVLNQPVAVWCVFDRDNNEPEYLNQAKQYGEQGLGIAFSNPCFEYWFHLHVKAHTAPVETPQKMVSLLKTLPEFKDYNKPHVEHPTLWEKPNLNQAKNNAKKRLSGYLTENDTPIISIDSDPITTIHHLIEALETLEQQQQQETTHPMMTDITTEETIYLGAGCFWGVETALGKIEGVLKTSVGYMGGYTENPTYKSICYGDTNHAEVVAVTYNPTCVKLSFILHVFFNIHDATQLNRQGPDVGTQYRSCIFTTTEDQAIVVKKSITLVQVRSHKPIVTTVEPAPSYWEGEAYHQQYFKKNPYHPNCHFFDLDTLLASYVG